MQNPAKHGRAGRAPEHNALDIAFGIVRLFPQGGLQRDCMRLAYLLKQRGHRVTIFTSRFDGPYDRDLNVAVMPVTAATNHGIDLAFARKLVQVTSGRFDRVVGFNKLLGLDMLYCADPSVYERHRSPLLRAFPRRYVQTELERASFSPAAATHILALTPTLADTYRKHWGTPKERFTIIPPGIDPRRLKPALRNPKQREITRTALGIEADRRVWLLIGAKPYIKGIDRALLALRSEPETVFLTVGVDANSRDGRKVLAVASRLRVADRVRLLGYREDIAELMAAADLLVHPARLEITGQVILEAVVNGLPAVVSGLCGFAHHVREADAGIVLPEPFVQADLEAALRRARDPDLAAHWSANGRRYGERIKPTVGLDVAADVIEHGPVISAATAAEGEPPSPHRSVPTVRDRRRPELISVIVTTHNREDALNIVLRALSRQTDRDFEVIVADDGSGPATARLVESWQPRIGVPLARVWHEHLGFRAAEIRNRAIEASRGRYCIFLDGDCIPRCDFVATHRLLAEPDCFVAGNRVLMSRTMTDLVLKENLQPETWHMSVFFRYWLTRDINRLSPLLQFSVGKLRMLKSRRWSGVRCCNLAVWRRDLERVDGFDSSFCGWGLEDSDLVIRLLRAGVRRKDGRFATGVLHLWHPKQDQASLAQNQLRLSELLRNNRVKAVRGLSALSSAAPGSLGSRRDV
jgi:glycosyltransferase involved in cell wall biosynthesis